MLLIKDNAGVDLVANPPAMQIVDTANTTGNFNVSCSLIEDDPALISTYVTGTLCWNDGSLPIVYAKTSGTIAVNSTHALGVGEYFVSLSASNFKSPVRETVSVTFPVTIRSKARSAEPAKLIFGPILPRDSGFPNNRQWLFNASSDIGILESSVKMLFLTAKGERLNEPEYGTNIRAFLFEQSLEGLDGAIQDSLQEALAIWEPRVALASITIKKTGRDVIVDAVCVSKLTDSTFNVELVYKK